MSKSGAKAANEVATKRAAKIGVNLALDNAWWDADAPVSEKVFGPCEKRDNVHQNTPQVNLHGMDEGATSKANIGALEGTILEAKERHNISATEVRSMRPLIMLVHSNVYRSLTSQLTS